jgi:uncharacterized membrane protein YfcA
MNAIADPQLIAALAVALLTGLVRGFSGFGAALVFVPLMSAVYDPKIAVPMFVITDILTAVVFLGRGGIWRKINWREFLPMAAAAIIAVQFGALVLHYADPITLRWGISALVALSVAVLAAGWRTQRKPALALTIAVGLLSGLLGGAVQIAGPPVIIYWLGAGHAADVLRASFLYYFSLLSAASLATYALHGLITVTVLAVSVCIAPVMYFGMWAGARLFERASDEGYRKIAYVIVALGAVVSLPLFDHVLRQAP